MEEILHHLMNVTRDTTHEQNPAPPFLILTMMDTEVLQDFLITPRHFRGSTVNIKRGTGSQSLLCHLRPCKISSINSSSTSSCSGKSIITVAASCQVMMLLLLLMLMVMVLVLTVLRVLLLLLLAPVLQVLFVQLMG